MSEYSEASLILPEGAGRATGLLPVLKPTDGTGDFTVVRAGLRHEINSDLKLELIAANVPAFNHATISGCPVLNTEPQATNLITYPISFDNAYWTKSGVTVVSGKSAPSVDFPTSAFKLVESALNEGHEFNHANQVLTTDLYSYSIYAKAVERDWVALSIQGTYTWFDLSNGVIGTDGNTGSSITPLADGWYKCSVYKTGVVASSYGLIRLGQADNVHSYLGDGVSGINIFMSQEETGIVASSPTFTDITLASEGSTTTRLSDAVSDGGDVNTFNSEEGVLFIEMAALDNGTSTTVFSISDGTNQETLYCGFTSTTNQITTQLVVGGVSQTDMSFVLPDITSYNKIAILYQVNNHKLYVNGSQVDIDTSGSTPSANTFDRMNLDLGQGSFKLNANVKSILAFKTTLTDAELTTLTTI